MAVISGTNTDPMGNTEALRLRVICLEGEGPVLPSSRAEVEYPDGSYSFTLMEGDYSIEVFNDEQWNLIGKVRITGGTPNQDLNDLLDTAGFE